MTDLPKIPKSAVAVLNIAGVESLEDAATWSADELAGLRGFGPKAFQTVNAAVEVAGLEFDQGSDKRSEPINVAMAKERMKGVPEVPDDPKDLPNIGSTTRRALAGIDVYDLAGVSQLTEKEFLALHGVGPKAARMLKPALAGKGLAFREEAGK